MPEQQTFLEASAKQNVALDFGEQSPSGFAVQAFLDWCYNNKN
jgi:hypothetical protein